MPKTKTQKQATIQRLSDALKNQQSVTLIDVRGVAVAQLAELRKQLKEQGAEMVVAKKTLLAKAFAATQGDAEINLKSMEGEIAAVFGYDDAIVPIKTLESFAKANDLTLFRGGYMEGSVMDAASVKQLASLPSKDILRGQLVGLIASPMSGFATVLQGTTKSLLYALNGIAEKKA